MAATILRENRWVRVYRLSSGVFVDSKYRLLECTAGPEEVIQAWDRAQDEEREDIEASLRFCTAKDRMLIVDHIAVADPIRAKRIEDNFAIPRGSLTETEFKAIAELYDSFSEEELKAGERLVLETRWFKVFLIPVGGYSYDSKVKSLGEIDLDAFWDEARAAPSEHREHYEAFYRFWHASKKA